MSLFDYDDDEAFGRVSGVDTGNVICLVEDVDKLRRLQINHLVVLRSSRPGQHLLGITTKILRKASLQSSSGLNEDLDESVQTVVENLVHIALIGTLLDRWKSRSNVFRRTLESVPEIDAPCFSLEGEKLTEFMTAIASPPTDDTDALKIGKYTLDEDADAWLDGNRFFQRHAVIVGGTGSGKSWTVAKLLEQVAELPMANAILFDIHGEYKPLQGDGIDHLRIAGPGDIGTGEGLEQGVVYLPYWLLTYEEMLALLVDRSDQNAPNQAMVFSKIVREHKSVTVEAQCDDRLKENFTIDSPIPYDISNVIQTFKDLDEEMVDGSGNRQKQGPFHGRLTRFVQRLEAKREDRRLGFLFEGEAETNEYDWLGKLCGTLMHGSAIRGGGGVKIVDFSEVPSDVLPLIVGLVARLLFSVQQWTAQEKRHPVAVFCDEAHLYIPNRGAGDSIVDSAVHNFERVSKEGRKYGVALVVISQRPSEVSRTVLSQCGNFIAMRLSNRDDRSVVQGLLPDSLGGIAESLPILDIGEALIVGDASLLPSRIRVDPPNSEPLSATVDFWDRWATTDSESGIESAVEAMRRQSRNTGA
ncbi:helicase HerA-like domain-containing protein [Halomonas sp. H10-9-1]|uniref:ATP-binding protein n=1 Tax=Halomonas sp. H10-9-1 TaxID=2950871 RepID=UPI0032DFB686